MIRLEVVQGVASGKSYELALPSSTIGRAEDCDVVLEDLRVSGRHARLVSSLGELRVEDLGSTNGTRIWRGPLAQATPIEIVAGDAGGVLLDGDLLELGQDPPCQLRVVLLDEERSAQLVSVKGVDEVATTANAIGADPVTLRALYDAQRRIGAAADLSDALDLIAQAVFELVAHATHVTVVLRESDAALAQDTPRGRAGAAYVPVLSRARGDAASGHAEAGFVPVPRSVYRKVIEERSAVLAADAPKEVGTSPSLMTASVRSTVAVPLWRADEIMGVVQVDNRDAPGMLKPRDLDVLLLVAAQASLAVANARLIGRLRVAEARLKQENQFLKARQRGAAGEGTRAGIVGDSEIMHELLAQVDRVADTHVSVLVQGETGSGKELIAAALHERSRRRDKLFVAMNCAAMAEGLLESELFGHKKGAFTGAHDDKQGLFDLADGSTLFLDEITEAPMAIQSKLLRALQEGEVRPVGAARPHRVNVRVVAATNRDLETEVQAGRFREDLFYRLNVFPLRVPPLRERRKDIPLLVHHFVAKYARDFGKPVAGIATEALQLLQMYDWPGNVRELQNEVQRLVIQAAPGGFLTPDLVSGRMRAGKRLLARAGGTKDSLRDTLQAVERLVIFDTLSAHDNNKTQAAKALGMTREGLHKKLRQYQ